MSSIPVFADAQSRLVADLAIVRLVRAGIPTERISAIFPRRRAPNTVCCWFKSIVTVPNPAKWPIAAAGLLQKIFYQGARANHVARELEALSLSPELAQQLVEKTQDGQIVLCVHASTENEAAIAWHVFQHVGAENIYSPEADLLQQAPVVIQPLIPQAAGMAA
jgi:hypothetical protein